MFARSSFLSFLATPVILSLYVLNVFSMPLNGDLSRRQIGDLQCNLDRLAVIASVGQTISNIQQIASVGSSDPAVTNATTTALNGLSSAESGIQTILEAIFAGQKAPADARDQVGDGLTVAQNALDSINSTDPAVTSAVSTAESSLHDAEVAADDVVDNCK